MIRFIINKYKKQNREKVIRKRKNCTPIWFGNTKKISTKIIFTLFFPALYTVTLSDSILTDLLLRLISSLVVAGQFESWDNVHGLELLKEQLAGVRDSQGGDLTGRLTVVTPAKQHIRKTPVRGVQSHQDNLGVII